MRTREEVTAEKIRGGFYSPAALVEVCLSRIEELTEGRQALRVLEPSAGDGAFVRGIERHSLGQSVRTLTAVETLESEAEKCRTAIVHAPFDGHVIPMSAISWAATTGEYFDVAVGNPPFVRFQFVPESDKRHIATLGLRTNVSFAGVSNLWIPLLIGSLTRLVPGGAFAFIVPAECFTGTSARVVRAWLSHWVDDLRVDLFPPGSFPTVLQEVVVLSGKKRGSHRNLEPSPISVNEYDIQGNRRSWVHYVDPDAKTWTRYLLNPAQLSALAEASGLPVIHHLGGIAKFEVAAVTGANEFFSVDQQTMDRYDLQPWAVPLLPRVRHAAGLRYSSTDHAATVAAGAKGMLLNFSADLPDPMGSERPSRYLAMGVSEELPLRYKCRIRQPWYRVPWIWPGRLMLSKRSHRYPRIILNEAEVVTTDTIYRGRIAEKFRNREDDIVAGFHNSLTLLTAEIEGRSFGGGVLELVPSEVGRLLLPLGEGFGVHLDHLDAVLRSQNQIAEDGEELIRETNALLVKAQVGLTSDLMDALDEARMSLLKRRLDRN
jgi:adenine-specific DNA-methyltransferase